LAAMTSEQIARMVIPCLEAGEPPPQLGQIVQGLPFDPDKARETLALISQRTGRSFDIPALLEEISVPGWIRNFPQDLVDFRITADDVAVTDEEVQALAGEARTDEAWIAREHLQMLLHLAAAEEDSAERQAALDLIVATAMRQPGAGQGELAALALRGLGGLAAEAGAAAEAGRAALRSLLSRLAQALAVREVWTWADDHPLLVNLRLAARPAAAALVHLLPQEHDPARRQVLIALAARLGDAAVEPLAARLNDPNPELVRPIVQALGQMRTAAAVRALRAAAAHPAVAVRREAMDALRTSQLPQAQDTLVAFLRDPDPEVRRHCIGQLTPDTVRRMTKDLVAMLAAPELARAPEVRRAVCEALVRGRAVEAIPQLRRHGSPFRLRAADRTVARHVRAAVAALERMQLPTTAAPRRAAS
ncbi:MAG: HEAT repeat domain-containing protein, partial [Armatimonadota bacterium]|nr:HEAT repeat domain-containing protein [Armatimonadota bacterium]